MYRVLLISVLLSGCSLVGETDPEPSDLSLRVDQSAYVAVPQRTEPPLSYTFDLVAQFENSSARTVYLARCYPDSSNPIYGLELVGRVDEWGAAYNRAYACVGHENPIAVGPGKTRTDTLTIIGPNAFTDEPLGVLEGRFRLFYQAQSCRAETGCDLPFVPGSSAEFEVRLTP